MNGRQGSLDAPHTEHSSTEHPDSEHLADAGRRGRLRLPELNRNDIIALLALLCVLAFGLRVWNFNWDSGHHQHPDERFWSIVASDISAPASVGEYFDSATSPANPYNHNDRNTWVYGTLPLWAGTAASAWMLDGPGGSLAVDALGAVGVELRNADGNPIFNNDYEANLVGRILSAAVDTATVLLVFWLATLLANRRVGLLAAMLQTFAVLHIQYAHFYGAEPWVALFTTIAMIGSIRIARREGSWRTRALTGLAVGLAISSKLTGLAVAVAPLAATLVAAAPALRSFFSSKGDRRRLDFAWIVHHGSEFVAMMLAAIVTFRIFQPYYFSGGLNLTLDQRFVADFGYISDVNSGGNVPWVIQWIDRAPLVFPLRQLIVWGMGPALALAVLIGLVVAVRRVVRRGELFWLVPLAVLGAYLVLVSRQFNPVIRYLLPAYPTAIALGAIGLAALWSSRPPAWRAVPDAVVANWTRITRSAAALLVAATAFYGLAYVNGVYNDDYTRLEASEWMIENLPPGSAVSSQLWDDRLPLGIPGSGEAGFQYIDLDPFRTDSSAAAVEFIGRLDQIDYVVEASNKLYGSIPQIPAKYPATIAYYDSLFDGSLGFEQIKEFHSAPSLLGITFDDRNAEETFTVYDHPTVTVWQKTSAWSVENAARLFQVDRADVAVDVVPRDANANALQLRPDDYLRQQSGGSWSDAFDPDGLTTNAPWLWWLLWFQIVGLAAVPLTTRVFRNLPGQAFGLSKVVGLLGIAMPLWILVSWGIVDFGSGAVWTATVLFVALGVALGWRRRSALRAAFAEHRRLWLVAEGVFFAIFFAVLALRYANPDLWHIWRGGEKPMELAYFTAVSRSTSFPPYDPWFAGGFLNYYYVGWYLLSVPTRALRLPPDLAFNVGVATYAAFAASVVYTSVSSLAALASAKLDPIRSAAADAFADAPVAQGDEADQPDSDDVLADTGRPWLAGLAGVVFFIVIGNLDGLRQTIRHLREASTTTLFDGTPILDPIFETLTGFFFWIRGGDLPQFDWWDVSRVNKNTWDITEFPAWTVLFADLHPHFMDMTIFGLVIVGLIGWATSTQKGDRRTAAVLAVAVGMGVALVRMVHTWDFPTAMVLGLAGLGIGWFLRSGSGVPAMANLRTSLVQAFGFGFGYLFVVTPYMRSSQVFENDLQWFPGFTSNLDDYLAHWGMFLFIAVAYFAVRVSQLDARSIDPISLGAVSLAVAVAFAYIHTRVGSVAAWVVLGVTGYLWLVWRELRRPNPSIPHMAAAGFVGLGFVITFGVEVVRVGNDIDRLNTVFKFWLQVWHLFAVGLAFGAWWVALSLSRSIAARRAEDRSAGLRRPVRIVWLTALALFVLAGALFPLRAPGPRSADRFDVAAGDGLSGYSWLDSGPGITTMTTRDPQFATINLADDVEMIDWLRTNVEGSPTVVEAVFSSYEWNGRVTSMTGLPAVVGWDHHQRQQRGEFGHLVDRRWADVKAFYMTSDPRFAEQFLRRYDVAYVIIGTTEKAFMGPHAANFEAVIGSLPATELAFTNGVTSIYEVDRPSLAQTSGSLALGLTDG